MIHGVMCAHSIRGVDDTRLETITNYGVILNDGRREQKRTPTPAANGFMLHTTTARTIYCCGRAQIRSDS